MRTDRVALFGLFGGGNLGNTSTLQAILDYLQSNWKGGEICCVCSDPEVVAEQHKIHTYPIDTVPEHSDWTIPKKGKRLPRMLRKLFFRLPGEIVLWFKTYRFLRNYDLFVVPGTGILDDFGVSPHQLPYDIFKWCLAAKLCGTPIYFVSIGAGPIVHPLSRFFMISALRLATYRSYRDQLSKDYLDHIGFDTTNDKVYPDLVFGLTLPEDVRSSPVHKTPKVIGLGVMQYYGWRNLADQDPEIYRTYIEKITRFTAWMLNAGYVVRLIIGQSHDQIASSDIQALLREKYQTYADDRLIEEPIHSVNDLFYQLSKTDLVVATRFHNILCSLMLNRPTISIGYARKNDVLMEEMGLGDYCQQIEEFDVDLLIEQFTTLTQHSEKFKTQIEYKNVEYRSALEGQYAHIFGLHSPQSAADVESERVMEAAMFK